MTLVRRILRKEEVTSTNEVAKALGKEGEAEGTIVVARRQSGGKGRMGRSWHSPKGGLYLSILLRPDLPSKDLLSMTVLACVPVAQAIEEVTGLDVSLKWPNDVMVQGKKVGGILVEGVSQGSKLGFVVLGIGLNVNTSKEELDPLCAISLSGALGRPVDEGALFDSLINRLERFYQDLISGKSQEDEYIKRSSILGHGIEATVGREIIRGKALYLEPNGALVIRSEEGLVLRLTHVNETSIRTTNNEEMHVATLRKD